jgi:predicted hydrocarbon binding protein
VAVGDKARATYKWEELESALASMDGILSFMFPKMGWGISRAVNKKGKDGKHMFLTKVWNSYEAHDVRSDRPVCNILESYLSGIGQYLVSSLVGDSTEGREVKCTAKGDDCCAFVIKAKDQGVKALDWGELEDEWQELIETTPEWISKAG